MEAKAVAKYVRMSSSKLKPVTDLVRGKDLKKSAAANAENNHEMNLDDLYVAEINANQGPTMKRWRAGAQGRAGMILKRTSHIDVVLREKPAKKPAKAQKPEETDKEEVR